jgi:hypothetical protein
MNEMARRGLLVVNCLMWLPSGLAEKISMWLPTARANEIRPFLPSKVAVEGAAAKPIATIAAVAASAPNSRDMINLLGRTERESPSIYAHSGPHCVHFRTPPG